MASVLNQGIVDLLIVRLWEDCVPIWTIEAFIGRVADLSVAKKR